MVQRACSLLIALCLVCFPLVPWVERAEAVDSADIQARLAHVVEYLRPQGYIQSALEAHDRVAAHTSKRYSVHLVSGVGNAIVAACDSNCDHVEVVLYDYQGKPLGPPTPDKQDLVIMKGNPQYSGLHEVEITVPGCHASECEVGIKVLLQQPGSEGPKPVNYNTYENRDLDGGDFDIIKNVDLEKCTSACDGDSRCRAYSFDKWNRFCFLKNHIASFLRLDPRSVTGVREDIQAPPLATTSPKIEHYHNRAFPGAGYKALQTGQSETCEAACRGQDRCVAYTFHTKDRVCHLFDAATEYLPAAGSESGAKVQEVLADLSKQPPSPSQGSQQNATAKPVDSKCKDISGLWHWFTGDTVAINANGTTQPSPTGIRSDWTCNGGVFVFKWSHGYTDRLSLSADGTRLSGSNNVGIPVWGTRK
jgi:hypothetical protein